MVEDIENGKEKLIPFEDVKQLFEDLHNDVELNDLLEDKNDTR